MSVKHNIWILVFVVFFSSCYKDLGDYDYIDHENIAISGIESGYFVLSGVDHIQIEPEVISTDPDAEIDFNWFVFDPASQNSKVNDTISNEKNLDYLVSLNPGDWQLVLSAKNLNTGYTAYFSSNLTVTTEFSRGWYVATDDGVNSNISLYYTSDEDPLMPDGRVAVDLLSNINGKTTPGTGGVITYCHDYQTFNPVYNRFMDTKVLMHLTGNEVSVVDINSFKVVKTFKDMFFREPDHKTPKSFMYSGNGLFMNNGEWGMHSYHTRMPNSGQFSSAMIKDAALSPYSLSKFYMGSALSNPVFFDETSSSFVSASGMSSSLISMTDHKDTEMSATNTGKKLLYMQTSYDVGFVSRGVAVMEDIANPDLKIVAKVEDMKSGSFLIDNDTLTTSDKMYNAKLFGQNFIDEKLIYFSVGNEIWSRSLLGGYENLQYIVPDGEEVVSISHKRETGKNINFIVIASQKGNEFIVRMFEKQAGNLASIPKIVIEGTGNFSDIIYVHTSLFTQRYSYLCPWSK